MKMVSVLVGVFIYLNSVAFAAHPLLTDDAKTVEQSSYELEVSYEKYKVANNPDSHLWGLSFKHGLTDKMDIAISFPFVIKPKPQEHFGPASIGLKFSIVKDVLSFSLSNELGSSEYFLNGIFSYEISPVMLHINLGYTSTGNQDIKGSIAYGFAFEYPFKRFDIVGEILGEKDGFKDYLFGLRYNIVEGVAASLGYGNNINKKEEKITCGFHYEFK